MSSQPKPDMGAAEWHTKQASIHRHIIDLHDLKPIAATMGGLSVATFEYHDGAAKAHEVAAEWFASQPKPQSDEGLAEAICDKLHVTYVDGPEIVAGMLAASCQAPVPTSGAVEVAEAHKQIFAAVQTTLANCLPGMKEPTRQAAAVSLALKLRELFAKGVA